MYDISRKPKPQQRAKRNQDEAHHSTHAPLQRVIAGGQYPLQSKGDVGYVQRTIGHWPLATGQWPEVQSLDRHHESGSPDEMHSPDIHHAAAVGVQGSGRALPHFDNIQQSTPVLRGLRNDIIRTSPDDIFNSNTATMKNPIQMNLAENEMLQSDDIHQYAQAGVQGTGQPIPHLDHIQQAFPNDDAGRVRAFTGPQAQRACRAIGAEAYAVGNKVAFKSMAPDLHTVVHEYTHTRQQRQGVQLEGGVGVPGDCYEQEADKIADAVVSGRPIHQTTDQAGDVPNYVTNPAVQCADGLYTRQQAETNGGKAWSGAHKLKKGGKKGPWRRFVEGLDTFKSLSDNDYSRQSEVLKQLWTDGGEVLEQTSFGKIIGKKNPKIGRKHTVVNEMLPKIKLMYYEIQNEVNRSERVKSSRKMSTGLPVGNIHFGVNRFDNDTDHQHPLGRRKSVMDRYGGTVAEYAWKRYRRESQYPDYHPDLEEQNLDKELGNFYEIFNQQIPVREDQTQKYKPIPNPYGKDPGVIENTGLYRYDDNNPGGRFVDNKYSKLIKMRGTRDELDYDTFTRTGTRFSKSSLVLAALKSHLYATMNADEEDQSDVGGVKVRFNLDYMGGREAIRQALDKQGDHADKVTSRELRFVKRYWDKPVKFWYNEKEYSLRFRNYVRFYESQDGSGTGAAKEVNPPWYD